MQNTIINIEKARTCGDGMEQPELDNKIEQTSSNGSVKRKNSSLTQRKHSKDNTTGNLPQLHSLYRRLDTGNRSLAPVKPKGELVALKPRLVTQPMTVPEHKKTKPPKFIPYEPYPAAISPMTEQNDYNASRTVKVNKNNLDINVLVDQMSVMRSHEIDAKTKATQANDDAAEIQQLKEQLKKCQEERDYYKSQHNFQTKVNAELKNLLVASVGEDLETRVNVLTEDKLQLARALLDTANHLTTHTEQIEFLAGQCEVWRSKFLASSVMVEELARWKADLTQKNQLLTQATKQLLQSMHQLREMQLEMLKNLKFLAKIRYLNLPSTDVNTLSAENINILQQMVLHSGVGMPENLQISSASKNPLCEAEKQAVQALEFISQPLMATDEAIRALYGQAHRRFSNTSSNMSTVFEQTTAATVAMPNTYTQQV